MLINSKIQKLLAEKESHSKKMKEIDIRITQLVGAVEELKSLLKD